MGLRRLLLAISVAGVLVGALAGHALAGTLNLGGPPPSFRAVFRAVTFTGVAGSVRCPLTLEGAFHARLLTKTPGTLAGYITRANLGPCEAGTATVLGETLPWHVRYASFTGALPGITALAFATVVRVRVREPFLTCLYESSAAILTFNRDVATRLLTTAEYGGTVPSSSCGGAELRVAGTSDPVTFLDSATKITVFLM